MTKRLVRKPVVSGGTGYNQDIANPFLLNSLTYNSTSTIYILAGGPLQFMGSASINQNSVNNHLIAEKVNIDASLTYTGVGSTAITGVLGGTGSGPATSTLLMNGTGTLTLSGTGGTVGNVGVQQGTLAVAGGSLLFNNSTQFFSDRIEVNGGAAMTIGGGAIVEASPDGKGFVNVDGNARPSLTLSGAGSVLHTTYLNSGLNSQGSLVVQQGGALYVDNSIQSSFYSSSSSTISVSSGGSISSGGAIFGNYVGSTTTATVDGLGSNWTISSGLAFGAKNPNATFGGTGSLTITNNGAVSAGATILNTAGSTLTVNGGTFTTGSLANFGGNGSIALTDPAGGTALTINGNIGSATYGGSISGSGSLLKTGTSTEILSGSNTFTGAVTVQGGTLEMATGAASSYQVTNGGLLKLDYGNYGNSVLEAYAGGRLVYATPTIIGGTLLGTGTHDVSQVTRFVGTQVDNGFALNLANNTTLTGVTSAGSITEAAGNKMTWNGGSNALGTLTINGTANLSGWTSTGITQINPGGTLNDSATNLVFGGGSRTYLGSAAAHGGSINLTGNVTIELNGGLLVNNGTITGTTDVNYGSLAKGSGTYGAVHVNDGGVFSPGNSPGSVTTGDALWGSEGAYLVELNKANGTAGVNSDFWNIQGVLTIGSGNTTNSHFTIDLSTLDSGNNAAALSDFNAGQNYSWVIAEASGGIVGFDPGLFSINTSGFLNPTFGGRFSITEVGNDIDLMYTATAVPEPSSIVLTTIGASGLMLVARRRRACRRRSA